MADEWITPIPKNVFFTKGVGRHKYRPQSLELAMRHAGIEKFNLVQVSGIVPARCKVITVGEGIRKLVPGQITFGVLSDSSSDEPNRLLCAGLGVAMPVKDQYGYISEHHGFGMTEEKIGDYVEDMAATMLATTLGIEFDPQRNYDERKEIYRMSGNIVRTRNIVQTAEGDKHGLWTTVIASAVFIMQVGQSMTTALHWFRRDLRLRDNTALFSAAATHDSVVAAFIIDPRWFGNPAKTGPHQATFYLAALWELSTALAARNIPLVIRTSPDPVAALLALAKQIKADTLTFNKDYEPAQIAMDERLEHEAAQIGLKIAAHKDSVLFEEQELLTGSGSIYSVFTPYKNAFLKRLTQFAGEPSLTVRSFPKKTSTPINIPSDPIPTPVSLNYPTVTIDIPVAESGGQKMLSHFLAGPIDNYKDLRDFPAQPGVSRLSAHLNAGTLSIRQVMHAALARTTSAKMPTAKESANHFISELIWRDFYKMILFNFPHTVSQPFQQKTAHLTWKNDPALFAAWASARTGYPIVDAAMAQLNTTGFMHNRLRMITAMFLTKDLDTHWTLGERYFKKSLIDYDQAANVGGWQWSASTGTDAAPYFRVMNPTLQSARFDPSGAFIRQFLPALAKVPLKFLHAPWQMPPEVQRAADCLIGKDYPAPIVDHAAAKAHAIAKFRTKPRQPLTRP